MSIFRKIENGQATSEQVETLRAVGRRQQFGDPTRHRIVVSDPEFLALKALGALENVDGVFGRDLVTGNVACTLTVDAQNAINRLLS